MKSLFPLFAAAILFAPLLRTAIAQTPVASPAAAAPDPVRFAGADRQDGESIYAGKVKELSADHLRLVLWVDRVISPNGKALAFSPPRTKLLRLEIGITIRTADTADLRGSFADLVPGAAIFALGKPGSDDAFGVRVRAVFLGSDGYEDPPGNLLKPWNDPKSWEFTYNENSAPGSKFGLTDRALHVTVGGNPTREWHARLFQNVEIKADTVYTLRFRARADTKHFLTVGSQAGTDVPYVNLGLLETVLLTPRWQTFQYTFTSLAPVPGQNLLPVFSAGHRGGTVDLADVVLTPGALPLPPSLAALQTARERAAASGKNLVADANDAQAWFLYSGEAARGRLTQETGPGGGPVLGVEVLAVSTQPWHLILMRPSLTLKEGQAYTLTFLARADRAREIDVQSQISKGDFHNIGLTEKVMLQTAWKPYTIKFTAHDTLPDHSRAPQFCLAATEGKVWIANVVLAESK